MDHRTKAAAGAWSLVGLNLFGIGYGLLVDAAIGGAIVGTSLLTAGLIYLMFREILLSINSSAGDQLERITQYVGRPNE